MKISEPVVVGTSKPLETRWGYFQFPTICRLPGGELMVSVNDADDAASGYGQPLKRFLSADNGQTWRPEDRSIPGKSPHCICAELYNGEYMILSGTEAFDVAANGCRLPPPVGKAYAYGEFYFYAVKDCPPPLQEYLNMLPAWRWTPQKPVWTEERVSYDIPGKLCWSYKDGKLVPRTWLERIPVRRRNEILYVDYRSNCLHPDGSMPKGFSCLLMTSRDNGRSFQLRSILPGDGRVYEPMLADTADGELVCVIRTTDQKRSPMLITYSRDDGRTWDPPKELFEFGVFPSLVRLDNGVLLLSFGRPGVWVSASPDGRGRDWTKPVPVIAGDPKNDGAHTCGYTGLLPAGENEALLVYSDFQHIGPDGRQCKSVEVRRITVNK